jgi:hypothetical protein
MIEIKHFDREEFDSPDQPGSGGNMRLSTIMKLDEARRIFGAPILVTSGFRTKAYGEALKKRGYQVATRSAHYQGYAVDLRPAEALDSDLVKWGAILDALWKAGFRRFGIMAGAIHVDDDPTKSSPALWNYNTTRHVVWAMAQNWFEAKRRSIK